MVSEPEEIVYDEDGPKILFGVGSGNYKVDVQFSQRPPNVLAVQGNQVTLSFRGMIKTCYKCFGCGHTASVCKKEKGSWEQYKLLLKDRFGMGPEFVGKTKDNMTKDSQGLSSRAVEEPVDEAQTVLETLSIDATNGYQKDAIENPTAIIPFLEQKRATDQMAEKQKRINVTSSISYYSNSEIDLKTFIKTISSHLNKNFNSRLNIHLK